jgi:hypothetical protein
MGFVSCFMSDMAVPADQCEDLAVPPYPEDKVHRKTKSQIDFIWKEQNYLGSSGRRQTKLESIQRELGTYTAQNLHPYVVK